MEPLAPADDDPEAQARQLDTQRHLMRIGIGAVFGGTLQLRTTTICNCDHRKPCKDTPTARLDFNITAAAPFGSTKV